MRFWAAAAAALLLVAGCSQHVGGRPQAARGTSITTPTSSAGATTPTKTSVPQAPPAAGAAIADVIAWIAAGQPADPGTFHSATRDGEVTQLQNDDVAFTTPSGKSSCMTDSMFSTGDLACLVKLTNPPPKPTGTEGHWAGGWIEFDGTTLTVGGLHGDPGRFVYGDGAQLPYGASLKFGDYQCRSDQTGLFCVNYAHRSAARISDAGVEPFGCLQPVPPPPDIGMKFSC
ncbi:MAG: hypothetical protein JO152_09420 [Mycobacteriaceae bacterium]|nr:hypothetical protein [Mycobacteriaceae bacterium]